MSYRRSRERNRRLRKLYRKTRFSYGRGAWFDNDKNRIIRYYPSTSTGYTKYLRRLANRRVRRTKDLPRKGNYYKKLYDYWWELF